MSRLSSFREIDPDAAYPAAAFAHLFHRTPETITLAWKKKLPPISGCRPYLYRGADILGLYYAGRAKGSRAETPTERARRAQAARQAILEA